MNPPQHITPLPDDGLEWLREIRRNITGSFVRDQTAIGDYLRQREKDLGDRIVRTSLASSLSRLEHANMFSNSLHYHFPL